MGNNKKLRTREYYLGYCFGAAMAERDIKNATDKKRAEDTKGNEKGIRPGEGQGSVLCEPECRQNYRDS